MIRFVVALIAAYPAGAQTIQGNNEPFRIGPSTREITSQFQEQVVTAPIALLRGLDKLTGVARDLEAPVGEQVSYGRLDLTVEECRYPQSNPTGNAYGLLTIRERNEQGTPIFEGWMVAASPALNALDHPRYDIWIKRCKLPTERIAAEPDATGPSSPRPTMRP